MGPTWSGARTREELDEIIARWARQYAAKEIDEQLNDAGVVCGPVYSVADIFENPQSQARDMLLEHSDPEIGPFLGPGIVPKFSGTPGAVRWSGTWDEGSHNRDVYGGLLQLSDDQIAELRREGVV